MKQIRRSILGIDQQRSSIMSKILNLVVSRYLTIALAGAIFASELSSNIPN